MRPNEPHHFVIPPTQAERCRVLCHQEGGIARVALFGEALTDPVSPINLLEQASIGHVSNDHYGHPKDAVFGNRLEDHMKGWESARSGFGEQAVFSFDQPIALKAFVVDTYLHRLNAPLSCHLFGLGPAHDLTDSMRSIPRWSVQLENGARVVPDDFQAYMQGRHYAEEGKPWPDALIIQLDQSQSTHWQPLLPFQALNPIPITTSIPSRQPVGSNTCSSYIIRMAVSMGSKRLAITKADRSSALAPPRARSCFEHRWRAVAATLFQISLRPPSAP